MVSFQTKNLNLGKFWRILDWKMLIYFMAIWNILQTFGIFYDHLVHFVFIWYIFLVLESCTKKNLATLLQIRFFLLQKNVGNKDSDQVFPISRFGLVSVDILCLHTQLVTFCPGMSALSINWHLPSHTMPHTLKAICIHIQVVLFSSI
jgi:hypothetical protein